MLIRFGTENHSSIRSYQELLLTASAEKDENGVVIDVPGQRLRLLPIVAVYGANASGKSNLLSALKFYIAAVLHSHTRGDAQGGTPYDPFRLDSESPKRPSKYDADFIIGEIRYHYGFKLDGKKIVEEWLYAFPGSKARNVRQTWFHRKSGARQEMYFGKEFRGENRTIEKLTRPDSLFISAAAQNSHPVLKPIYDFFAKKLISKYTEEPFQDVSIGQNLEGDADLREKTIAFLRNADIGIADFIFEKQKIKPKQREMMRDLETVLRKHIKSEFSFAPADDQVVTANLEHFGIDGKKYRIALDHESSGTLALLRMLSPLFKAFAGGGVMLVDELSNALHPLVSRKLLELINSPTTNPSRAQLVFSTHDTNLLTGGVLRRDQIWFTEKDRDGATHVYPLSDINVRKTDNLERGYLQGRFGAIPFLGGIDEIVVSADAKPRKRK